MRFLRNLLLFWFIINIILTFVFPPLAVPCVAIGICLDNINRKIKANETILTETTSSFVKECGKADEEKIKEQDAKANARCGNFNVYYSGDVVLTPNVTATVHNYSTGESIITDLIVNGHSLYKHLPAEFGCEQQYHAALSMLKTQSLPSGTVNHVDITRVEELYEDLRKLDIELYYGTIEYKNKRFVWVG